MISCQDFLIDKPAVKKEPKLRNLIHRLKNINLFQGDRRKFVDVVLKTKLKRNYYKQEVEILLRTNS